MARMDAMGITTSGIQSACNLLQVKDAIECAMKVNHLSSYLYKLEKKREKEKEKDK